MKHFAVLIFSLFFVTAHAEDTGKHGGENHHEEGEEHREAEPEDHSKHSEKDEHAKKDEHGSEHAEASNGEHKEEGGEAEENNQVGPDKGILEASEKLGFKLSPEATKNFKLKFMTYSGGPVTLSMSSVLQSIEEKNVYRFRNGLIKRVDISIHSRTRSQITFTSQELQSGDQIVIEGLGFLRMAELAAFGGASEGHGH